ncbi:MAG TPA: hypothetical protein VI980_01595 [Acidimicrobiia bacterium]|nr:hypothetical protein [Acidimicrobiia bacterium]
MVWWAPAIALGLSVILVAVRRGEGVTLTAQATAILMAMSVGFALDDPSYELVAPSPSSLLHRRRWRVLVIVPPTAVAWMALVWWQGPSDSEETWVLAAMFAGLVGLSLGVAGAAGRRSRGRGGPVVAPIILVALILSSALPPRWRPMPMGDVPGGWSALYIRWWSVAVVGVLMLLVSSRDPARRRVLRAR